MGETIFKRFNQGGSPTGDILASQVKFEDNEDAQTKVSSLEDGMGVLDELETDDKSSLVAAINEVHEEQAEVVANEAARQTAEAARVAAEERRVEEYGQFEFDINQALNSIEGQNDLPSWTERPTEQGGGSDRAYAPGQYLLHPWTNPVTHVTQGYVYRTLASIAIGDQWNEDVVVMTSVFGELNQLLSGDETVVYINLSSSDGELDVEGLSVQVAFEDGSTPLVLTTNAEGICVARIEKGKVFMVSVAEQTGYLTPGIQKFKANWNERYVYVIYEKGLSALSNITVTCTIRGTSQGLSPIIGGNVTLFLSDGGTPSAIIDSNGVASFTVRQGLTGYVRLPNVAGLRTPSRINFDTNFQVIGLNAEYEILTAGLFMVRDDGAEIDFYAWDDADTCVALHIATQTLIGNGADYYIDIAALDSSWFTTARRLQWATQNVDFPNVPTDYDVEFDGSANTSNMLTDAADLGIRSPVAEWATQQTLVIADRAGAGFIGTRGQLQAIFDNKITIYDMVIKAGLTPAYNDKYIWTSTQKAYNAVHIWRNGAWGDRGKTNTDVYVVPFYRI